MRPISDNARQAFSLLREKGYAPHHAAAMVGNMMQESGWGIDTGAVGDNGNAYGAVQWNGPRRKAFLKYAKERGADPADLRVQIDYMDRELKGSERRALDRIAAAGDLDSATVTASQAFWRPGDPRNENRKRYARAVARQMVGQDDRVAQAGMSDADNDPTRQAARKVTDPALLAQLNAPRKVTDPDMLARLNAPAETPDGPQPGQTAATQRPVAPLGVEPVDVLTGGTSAVWPQGARDVGNSFAKGFSGGWSDEVMAWAAAAPKEAARAVHEALGLDTALTRAGPVMAQDQARERTRLNASQADFDQRQPVLSGAAEIAGMGTSFAGLGGGLPSLARGTLAKVGLGAAEGAGAAAGVAAGNADPGQRVDEAIEAAPGGAALGAAATRAGIALDRYLKLRAARRATPDSAALKQSAQEMYDAAANSGVVYRPDAVQTVMDDIATTMSDELIDPTQHPQTVALLRRLPELLSKPATLREVERYRQLASGAARSAKPGSPDERMATLVLEAIDEFTLDQGNMVLTSGGAATQREARRLWSQYRKDQLVEAQIEKAVRRADSTGSGGNANNAIRQNIRSILDNKKLRRGFTPEEIGAMETIVRGGSFDNFLRLAGKLSPSGNGLMLALQTAGGVATNLMSLPLAIAGHGAKLAADSATTRRVKALATLIRAGAKPPPARMARLSGAERRALADLVAAEGGPDAGERLLEAAERAGDMWAPRRSATPDISP